MRRPSAGPKSPLAVSRQPLPGQPVISEEAIARKAAELRNEGDEAWRAYYWGEDRLGMRDETPAYRARLEAWERRGEELRARYGSPGWGPLLYASVEAQASWKLIAETFGHRIPEQARREHWDRFPNPRAPKGYSAANDDDEEAA